MTDHVGLERGASFASLHPVGNAQQALVDFGKIHRGHAPRSPHKESVEVPYRVARGSCIALRP